MRYTHKFTLFVFLIIVSFNSFSQDSTSTQETEVKSMLCSNWKAVSLEANGRKAIVTKSSLLSFKNDGTFTDSTEGLGKSIGSWTYNPLSKMLETIDKGGKSKAKLIELTDNKLIMEFEYPDFVSRVTYAKVDRGQD